MTVVGNAEIQYVSVKPCILHFFMELVFKICKIQALFSFFLLVLKIR